MYEFSGVEWIFTQVGGNPRKEAKKKGGGSNKKHTVE